MRLPNQVYFRKACADHMMETMKSAHPPPTYLPTYPNKEVTHPNIGTPYLPWYPTPNNLPANPPARVFEAPISMWACLQDVLAML